MDWQRCGRIYSDYICTPLRRDDCLVREREGKTDMMDMSRYSVDYETCCMYIPYYLLSDYQQQGIQPTDRLLA